jgi:hypothetical protein
VVISKKEKVGKKKEGEPPYGKVENAKSAFPTFPQGLPPGRKNDGRRDEPPRRAAAPPTFLLNSTSPACNLSARFFCNPSARHRRRKEEGGRFGLRGRMKEEG